MELSLGGPHTNDPAQTFADAAAALDAELDRKLAALRADLADGSITVAEAATERVEVLERHLARLVELRQQYLT